MRRQYLMPDVRKKYKPVRVVELFAGVGGFRVGLDCAKVQGKKRCFETIWANQWEPATGKNQHAAWVYEHVFFRAKGLNDAEEIRHHFSNEDINKVVYDPKLIQQIPNHDVLTGGFPCQDYSVARPLSQAAGIEGKKGILWWSIYEILRHKIRSGHPTKYLFLENVDRLLKSPASRRGRDFAIMLSCLSGLGYVVEWRVVNAGDYGFPQRRRRTYILGYYRGSAIEKEFRSSGDKQKWILSEGILAKAFPVNQETIISGSFRVDKDPKRITRDFTPIDAAGIDSTSPFQNAGIMADYQVYTARTKAVEPKVKITLGDIIAATEEKVVDEKYYIPRSDEARWQEQKAAHSLERVSKGGHRYLYTEGALPFPDKLDRGSRTIITSEGGRTPTRFKHVIDISGRSDWKGKTRKIGGKEYRYRRLTPEELEALCMFDRGHTAVMYVPAKRQLVPVPDTKRAFFMGNALVVGVITRIGKELLKRA